jgi:hypothetical protein
MPEVYRSSYSRQDSFSKKLFRDSETPKGFPTQVFLQSSQYASIPTVPELSVTFRTLQRPLLLACPERQSQRPDQAGGRFIGYSPREGTRELYQTFRARQEFS